MQTDDGVYAPNGQLLRSGAGSNVRFVGTAFSFLAEWQVNRHVSLSLSYAHMFREEFIEETGPDKVIDFVKTTLRILF